MTIVPNITALLVPIMDAARAVVRAAAAVLNRLLPTKTVERNLSG